MAQFANTFTVSGIVCNDAVRHDFGSNHLAKFGLSISRSDERAERGRMSAILNCEAWRKTENAWMFDKHLKKGQHITITGFFKPQEWKDANGQDRSSVILECLRIENTDMNPKEEKETAESAAENVIEPALVCNGDCAECAEKEDCIF